MLINLSNHPSSQWDSLQLNAASQYGEIKDIPFPEIEPQWDTNQVYELAKVYLQQIMEINSKPVVHLMGEFSFCFKLVELLKSESVEVVVSTSDRQSVINSDGTKTIRFNFVRFRKY